MQESCDSSAQPSDAHPGESDACSGTRRIVYVAVNLYREAIRSLAPELAAAGFDVRYTKVPGRCSAGEAQASWGIIAGDEAYPASYFAPNSTLRVISRTGTGYDNIDVDSAGRSGCLVCVSPALNHFAVADHTMGLILSLSRGIVWLDRIIRGGSWTRPVRKGVGQSVLGIVGLGSIGREVARRARAFRMRVLAYDPRLIPETAHELRVDLVDFETLLAGADIVTLHVPLLPDTRHLINARTLSLMKPGALLVNTSRGQVVDEGALIAAIRSRHLGGAALDVFETEPVVNPQLFQFENVICTPHIAGNDEEAVNAIARSTIDNILGVGRGEIPMNCVNCAAMTQLAPMPETTCERIFSKPG